jgi:hypothetical protein
MSISPATHTSIEDIGAGILRSWWFLALVSAAVVILLALASWPWWFNRFVLKATTRVVEISASAPGVHGIDVNLPKSVELQIFGAQADGRPPELAVLGAADSVRLVASSAKLQSISLPSGAGLVVRTTSDGGVDLGVLNNGFISVARLAQLKISMEKDNGQQSLTSNGQQLGTLGLPE